MRIRAWGGVGSGFVVEHWEGVGQLGTDKKILKEGAASTYLDIQAAIEIRCGSVEAGTLCPCVRRGIRK